MTVSWGRVVRLAFVGGLAFWVANLAISLTPIAADYRAALSIPYVPMLVGALVGGLLIAFGVSWALVRHPEVLPTLSPIVKSLVLSMIVLVVVTLLIDLPSKVFLTSSNPVRYFLIGTAFNAVRILALGVAIGVGSRGIVAGRGGNLIRHRSERRPGARLEVRGHQPPAAE